MFQFRLHCWLMAGFLSVSSSALFATTDRIASTWVAATCSDEGVDLERIDFDTLHSSPEAEMYGIFSTHADVANLATLHGIQISALYPYKNSIYIDLDVSKMRPIKGSECEPEKVLAGIAHAMACTAAGMKAAALGINVKRSTSQGNTFGKGIERWHSLAEMQSMDCGQGALRVKDPDAPLDEAELDEADHDS